MGMWSRHEHFSGSQVVLMAYPSSSSLSFVGGKARSESISIVRTEFEVRMCLTTSWRTSVLYHFPSEYLRLVPSSSAASAVLRAISIRISRSVQAFACSEFREELQTAAWMSGSTVKSSRTEWGSLRMCLWYSSTDKPISPRTAAISFKRLLFPVPFSPTMKTPLDDSSMVILRSRKQRHFSIWIDVIRMVRHRGSNGWRRGGCRLAHAAGARRTDRVFMIPEASLEKLHVVLRRTGRAAPARLSSYAGRIPRYSCRTRSAWSFRTFSSTSRGIRHCPCDSVTFEQCSVRH